MLMKSCEEAVITNISVGRHERECVQYGVLSGACPLSFADKRSLELIFMRSLMRVFKTTIKDIIKECSSMFNLQSVNC